MTFQDAVRELAENPSAEAITFTTERGEVRRMELKSQITLQGPLQNLYFKSPGKPDTRVNAGCPDFILREDFIVVYKKLDIYTTLAAGMLEKPLDKVSNADRAKAKEEFYKSLYRVKGFALI